MKDSHTNYSVDDIYCDVHPFKETDIWLDRPNASEKGDSYINANRIQSVYHESNEENLIIAAQGPLSHTVDKFWIMALQMNVGVVITPILAIGTECAQYFPESLNTKKTYGEVEVTLLSEE